MGNSELVLEERQKYMAQLEQNKACSTHEEAVKYTEALMTLIFNFKMVGYVYEYYTEDVVYKTADARKITSPEGVAIENMAWIAAFTDFKINIEEGFASGDYQTEFQSYLRYYCTGTNNGPSVFGRPTFQKMEGHDYIGMSLFTFRKMDDGVWRIVKESSIKSNYKVEMLIRENQPVIEEA